MRLALLLALVGLPRLAAADIVVTWSAPDGCEGGDGFLKRVAAHAEADPHETTGIAALAVTIVEGAPGSLVLDLRIDEGDATGTRTLTGTTCPELVDAAALIVAMLVDEKARAAAAAGRRALPPEPDPAGAVTESPQLTAGLTAGVGAGHLPEVAPSAQLFAAVVWRALRIEAHADVFPRIETQAPTRPGAGGRFSLWLVGLRACASPALAIDACLGGEIGVMHAEGFGVEQPRSTDRAWQALVAGVGRSFPLGAWLALRADLAVAAPLERSAFVLGGEIPVHTTPVAGVRAHLGVEVRFP